MKLRLNANFLSLNICTSLRICNIQTTEDAENLEIAKSMRVGDQKQKYDLEWPKYRMSTIVAATMYVSYRYTYSVQGMCSRELTDSLEIL